MRIGENNFWRTSIEYWGVTDSWETWGTSALQIRPSNKTELIELERAQISEEK